MNRDSLLQEIHETRARLLAEAGGDLKKLIERLRSRESEEGQRILSDEQAKPISGERSRSPSSRDYRKR